MNTPRIKFEKVIQVFLWIAALGVLVENIVLFRQNRILQGAMGPQISAGTQLRMPSGLSPDGRIVPVGFPAVGSELLIFTFSITQESKEEKRNA